jgi:ABC-type dipeptide/oligopeptide/nickel transport system ATPase subunit
LSQVVETEDGRTYAYPGGYSDYKRLKAERMREWNAAWEKQEREESELRAFVQKMRTNEGMAGQVRAKEKQLERLRAAPEYVAKPPSRTKQVRIEFPPAPRSAKELVTLEGVTQRYGQRTIFKDVDLVIERGDRVAIVGPNGAGKSTLLRLILGQEAPTEGRAVVSGANAVVAYFEQDQANALDMEASVLTTMQRAADETAYEGLRALLGRFMFKVSQARRAQGQGGSRGQGAGAGRRAGGIEGWWHACSPSRARSSVRLSLAARTRPPSLSLVCLSLLSLPLTRAERRRRQAGQDALRRREGTPRSLPHDAHRVQRSHPRARPPAHASSRTCAPAARGREGGRHSARQAKRTHRPLARPSPPPPARPSPALSGRADEPPGH